MPFREHGFMLFLSKDLYLGVIQLQADKKLGRAFSGLLPLTEGLYRLGYITKEVYEVHKRKYSASLVEDNTPTLEKLHKKTHQDDLVKQFSNIIKDWPNMKAKSKDYWVKRAKEHADIPNAKMILDLGTVKVKA